MATYLIRKLEQFTSFSTDDKKAIEQAARQKTRELAPRQDIVTEGETPKHVNLILEGFACRYKTLEDGRRQIVAFVLPGDMCDLRMFILKQMDHSIGTVTPVRLAEISPDALVELTDSSGRIARALWWNSLVEEAIAREWILNVGQRNAFERLAHVLCEFFVRLRAVGLADGNTCQLPITQAELADALGLSHVHTNRTLQELRGAGLITWRGKTLIVHDLRALMEASLFNPNYLHLNREGQDYSANPA